MHRTLAAILVSSIVSGCTMFDTQPSTAATLLPRLSADEAAAVPEGARVHIDRRFTNAETTALTTGVVLKASRDGLALANCSVVGTSMTGTPILNKVPYVSRLFKNTGIGAQTVPVLWVPLEQISSVRVLEPPPADYVAPSIEISTAEPQPIGVDFDWQADDTGLTPVIVEPE